MSDPIVIKPRAAPLSTTTPAAAATDLSAGAARTTSTNPRLLVALGALLLLAALFWVFVLLPGSVTPSIPAVDSAGVPESGTLTPDTASSQNDQTAAAQPPANTPVSPFRDAQLARAKELAEKELATFVELQIELEDKLQITDWGQSRYDAVKDLATQGDVQFQARDFESALTTYRQATAALDDLRAAGEAEFAAGVAAGNAALTEFNQLQAQREFARALRVKPDDPDALAGQQRAERLPEIQALLRKARQLTRRGDIDAATTTYQEILSIDPQTATVAEALADLATAAKEADYQNHLSKGFAALESGRFSVARRSFNDALVLRPNDSVALGGLQQLEQKTEVQRLQNLQSAALQAVAEERWEDAVKAFDEALATDKNLAFAQSGRKDAQERMRLFRGMNTIIEQSEKLSDNNRMREAIALLDAAAALPAAGPRWSEALARSKQRVASYQQPVPVRLTSDNATLVTVFKVGRLGTFKTHDLELRPGAYTIVGSADGCQDVRKEIIVKPEMDPVNIACENRL